MLPTVGPVFAGMIGGAVSGAILGAIDGGLGGALKGAAWGAGIGGILGAGYAGFEHIGKGLGGAFLGAVAVGGAVYAGVSGGLEGLGDYAAGAAGAFYGGTLGNALVNPSAYAQTQAETQSTLSESEQQETIQRRSAGQLTDTNGTTTSGTPPALESHEKAKITSNLAKNGGVGKGNNPIPTYAEKKAFYNTHVGPVGEMIMGIKTAISQGIGYAKEALGWIIQGIQLLHENLKVDTGKGIPGHFDDYIKNPENKPMRLRELEAGTDRSP